MKKLIALMALFLFTVGYMPVFAGDHKDGVKMKDGKVWVTKDGNTTGLTQELTLSDGSKVSTNGTVTMKDGTTKMMSNGDMIHMDGKWHDAKMSKEEKKAEKEEKKVEKDKM